MKQSQLEILRKQYPIGARVELIEMDDVQAPPIGTKGTVVGVDDIGSVMVDWDNGSTLNVVYGEDKCRVLQTIKTICYGKERNWDNAKDAMRFFMDCFMNSDGAERERYSKILLELEAGLSTCYDE